MQGVNIQNLQITQEIKNHGNKTANHQMGKLTEHLKETQTVND